MNKQEFIKTVVELLCENEIKKPISIPKQTFHISDDDGNSKKFTVKRTDKSVQYTRKDVISIMDACIYVVQEALKRGEPISISGFGTLGLNYRKPRVVKHPDTDKNVYVNGRYVPKFTFGNDLRMCAKIYELSLDDKISESTYDTVDKGGVD